MRSCAVMPRTLVLVPVLALVLFPIVLAACQLSVSFGFDPDAMTVEEVWRKRGPNERETRGLQSIISTLLEKDHAYVADDGVVYFSVESFPDYGNLSGNTLENLKEGEGGRISAEHQAATGGQQGVGADEARLGVPGDHEAQGLALVEG